MRALGTDFDFRIVASIDARLNEIASRKNATLLLAVESGSRAWGFPSPDSDYDCRFIYARRWHDYVQLYPPRDVIEFPTDSVLDVNGWDLPKALRLLLKGNAVVIEWLMSPYVYDGIAGFREEALALARTTVRPGAVARHYLHLGERQRRAYFTDERAVPVKKIFYALRPAMALRWLRLHAGEAIAPMRFQTLTVECAPPSDVTAIVEELLVRKAVIRELGTEPLPTAIGTFIDAEFALAPDLWPREFSRLEPEIVAAANDFLRRWLPQ